MHVNIHTTYLLQKLIDLLIYFWHNQMYTNLYFYYAYYNSVYDVLY